MWAATMTRSGWPIKASSVYRRDLGVLWNIPNGYLRLWTNVPPWGVITTFNDIVTFRDWWSGPATRSASSRARACTC